MISVNQLLKSKGHDIWSISPDATISEALGLLAEKDVGALLVIDDGNLVGILSERDYAREVAKSSDSSLNTSVHEIMTSDVVTVRQEQTVEECMALMTENRFRHLPIFDEDQLVGVISIGDVVKAVISDQRFIIDQLENYITG